MSRCKSCGKEIIWIKLASGKWNPCDKGRIPYKADENGKHILVTEQGDVVRCNVDITSFDYGYTSHFATCPNANAHRKGGGSDE